VSVWSALPVKTSLPAAGRAGKAGPIVCVVRSHPDRDDPVSTDASAVSVRTVRDGLVFPVVIVVAMVLIWSLPDLVSDPTDIGLARVEAYRGVVMEVEPMELDQEDPFAPPEGEILVRLSDGPRAGEDVRAFVNMPYTSASAADFAPGDEVVVTFTDDREGAAFIGVSERWRLPALVLLVAAFAAVVVLIGGWQGARALLSLAFTIVVVRILVPAILDGIPPVPLAVGIAALVTSITILLTEGFGRPSLAAILGTLGGLAITALISAGMSTAVMLTGSGTGDLFFVELPSGEGLDLRGILLAAIIIGAVGVLDDMTVTQAATVHQLASRSTVGRRTLWVGAMQVGRSHIAATVNTLFLAYVGASLPAIILLALAAEPTFLTLDREPLALEVVRTLAGSLGIVLAMPLTTAIAIALVARRQVGARHGAAGTGVATPTGSPAVPAIRPRSGVGDPITPREPTAASDGDGRRGAER
jgi:uncharacterized membrane protein